MKKIVIIGGGFAGSFAANKLEDKFDVTLIDNKDYFEFTPGIPRALVEPEHKDKIQIMHKDYLKNTKFIRGSVKEIGKNYVKINNKKINFDFLLIASGSNYKRSFKEVNVNFSNRKDNIYILNSKIKSAKTVLIIGGGLVGTELAAEISEKYKDKKIKVIHSGERLIERNPIEASEYALKILKKNGVEVIFNEFIKENKKNIFLSKNGERYTGDIVFLCIGIKANSDFMKKIFENLLDKKGFIKVEKDLRVCGSKNIFAVGDVNNIAVEKTAQNAQRQAKIAVKNINALVNNKELREYSARQTPLVISLGKYNGLFIYKSIVIKGIIPALMKYLIEKFQMLKKNIKKIR